MMKKQYASPETRVVVIGMTHQILVDSIKTGGPYGGKPVESRYHDHGWDDEDEEEDF